MKYLSKVLFIFFIFVISFCFIHAKNDTISNDKIHYIQNPYQNVILITQNHSTAEINGIKTQSDDYYGLTFLRNLSIDILAQIFNSQYISLSANNISTVKPELEEISIRAP